MENRDLPNSEEENRLEQIRKSLKPYSERLTDLTTHTLAEAQKMVSYPISKPIYIPEGYKQVSEEIHTPVSNVGKDPIVELEYGNGKYDFSTPQYKIGYPKDGFEFYWNTYENKDSYFLKGFEFVYATDVPRSNVTSMMVTVQDEGYKIALTAEMLSKKKRWKKYCCLWLKSKWTFQYSSYSQV